jgi:hypothetical protein
LAINWGAADQELVNVTARPSGTTLTIVRGQDGTGGIAHPVGATVTHDVSARDFNEAGAHVGASAGVHGISGSVVGTTDTQTLSGKTLTSPTANTPVLNSPTVNTALTVGGTDIMGAWQPYTPTWSSSTPPTLGTTTLNGAYLLIGKTCIMAVTITVGSGFSAGSGNYVFSLPFTSSNFSPAVNYTGNARLAYGTARWVGQVSLGNNSNLVNITTPTSATNSTGTNITGSVPGTPVAGDTISFALTYQIT